MQQLGLCWTAGKQPRSRHSGWQPERATLLCGRWQSSPGSRVAHAVAASQGRPGTHGTALSAGAQGGQLGPSPVPCTSMRFSRSPSRRHSPKNPATLL